MPSAAAFSGDLLASELLAVMSRLEAKQRRAFLAMFEALLGTEDMRLLMEMIGSGELLVVTPAMYDTIDALDLDTTQFRDGLRQAMTAGGKATAKSVGLEGSFTITNPRAIQAARTLSAALEATLKKDAKQNLRDIITESVEGSLSRAETLKRIKAEIGLTAKQATALKTYRQQLIATGKSNAQVASMTQKYGDRLLKQRASTIARTEVARAVNIGQKEAWWQMRDNGLIPPTTMRVWITAQDEKVCPTCGPMNNELAPLDGVWDTAFGPTDIPHAHPNCRCTSGLVFTNKVKKIDPLGLEMWLIDKGGKGGLTQWFAEDWVDLSRPKKGGGFEPCGRKDASSGKYPKCVPASRAAKMTPAEIKSAIRRKRRAESTQERDGKKPIMVDTVVKVNVPADIELYNAVKEEAKQKFDVYPSAYANGWLVQEYKRRGGKYKTVEKGDYLGHPFRGNQWSKGTSVSVFERAAGSPVSVDIRDHEGSVSVKLSVTALTGAEVDPRFASYAGQRRGDTEVGSILWYKETGVIEGIGVAREFQRKGVATALLEQARAYAESKGYPKVVHSDKLTEDGAAWAAVTKEGEIISLPERPIAVDSLMKGDYVGHPFRGNQWTGGRGGRGDVLDALTTGKAKGKVPASTFKLEQDTDDMQKEIDSLTPEQQKKYWATPKNYTHEQGMLVALKPDPIDLSKAPSGKPEETSYLRTGAGSKAFAPDKNGKRTGDDGDLYVDKRLMGNDPWGKAQKLKQRGVIDTTRLMQKDPAVEYFVDTVYRRLQTAPDPEKVMRQVLNMFPASGFWQNEALRAMKSGVPEEYVNQPLKNASRFSRKDFGDWLLTRAVQSVQQDWAGSSASEGSKALMMGVASTFKGAIDAIPPNNKHYGTMFNGFARYKAFGALYDGMARAMYQRSQEYLKEQGISEVYLYRGTGQNIAEGVKTLKVGYARSLSSWSVDPNVSTGFGDTLLQSSFPASRVLSMGALIGGLGCANEQEFVVIGTKKSDRARVFTTNPNWGWGGGGQLVTKATAQVLTLDADDTDADWLRTIARKNGSFDASYANTSLAKGDYVGHPFRGNQWTGGSGGANALSVDALTTEAKTGNTAASAEEAFLLSKQIRQDAYLGYSGQAKEKAEMYLQEYTQSGYAELNESLRKNAGLPSFSVATFAKQMDAAFKNSSVKLTKPITLMRGMVLGPSSFGMREVETKPSQVVDAIMQKFAKGTKFTDHGWVSTSFDPEVAYNFNDGVSGRLIGVTMRIRVPAGQRVVAGNYKEDELILKRGTKFKVVSITGNAPATEYGSHMINIELEVVTK